MSSPDTGAVAAPVRTVYLIAQPTVSRTKRPLNLAPLYDHGEVKVVLPDGDSPTFSPSRTMSIMDARFKDFDPERDFLVWAGGDTLSAVMVGYLLAERNIEVFTWLRYERGRDKATGQRVDEGGKYIPVQIDLGDPQLSMPLSHEDGDDDDES